MAFPESRILTSSDLIEILYNGRKTRHFCFILGSGASVESGIPSGNTLEMEWMNCLMGLSNDRGTRARKPDRTEHFADELLKEKKISHSFKEIVTEWEQARAEKRSMSSDYYFDVYRLRFHPDVREGYRYLEKIMDPCKPSLGYHPLALMLTEGNQNNLVITTNFDSLVEDSLFLYTDKKPLVVSHESLANFIDPDVQRPIVAKVHRGLMYGPFNSPDTTDDLKPEWKETLDYAFKTYTPIVIGYGGGDGSLMKALQEASFRNGIYWCFREASGLPDPKIQDFVEKQNGCLVSIDGFDALMMEMGRELFGQRIAPSETRHYLQSQSDLRMRTYTEQWNKLDKQPHMEAVLEPLNQAEEEAREKRAEENALTYWDYFDRAYKAAEEGRHEDAIRDYTLCINLDPNDADAYYNRGICYNQSKQYEQSIKDYDKVIELNPHHTLAHNNRGNSYVSLGKIEQALQDYHKAIELDPNCALAYNNRGNLLYDQGLYELAILNYNKAIELDSHFTTAYNNRGHNYSLMGYHERAIQDYDKVIELNPNDAVAYNIRGIGYSKLGQHERAIQDYDKAIELDSSYASAYNSRAFAYAHIGVFDKAISDIEKALSLKTDYPPALHTYGFIYLQQENYPQAIEYFTKALSFDDKLKDAYEDRARAYRAIGETALAEADEAKAAELEAEEKKNNS